MNDHRKLVLPTAIALGLLACARPTTRASDEAISSTTVLDPVGSGSVDGHPEKSSLPPASSPTSTNATARLSKLPVRFEANAGQWDPRVRFKSKSRGATLFLTDDGVTVGLKTRAVTMKLVGETLSIPRGEKELETKSNFFLGDDPKAWRTEVPNYAQVRTRDALRGVDVVWHGGAEGLEYDLEVAPGVDATKLALEIGGASALEIARDGSLRISTSDGTLQQLPPKVTQGGRQLATRYVRIDAARVGFSIDGYDPRKAILIDPVLVYSTYLGGTADETGFAIAVDASGNAYVAGRTGSANFPAVGGFQLTASGTSDAFISKLSPSGSSLIYSTYLGSDHGTTAYGIAVDTNGNAYVVGFTDATAFPIQGAIQSAYAAGAYDGFLTKLSPSGSALVYSTYLGGSGDDAARAVAVDTNGNAYVIGDTSSTDFPTHAAMQPAIAGDYDAFVSKINPSGSAFVYSTYLGGGDRDVYAYPLVPEGAIAVDQSGNAYVTGTTSSPDFPTHVPLQATIAGGSDAFVTEINSGGSALLYSTYLGGSSNDLGQGIALDSTGNAYVTGATTSSNFPTHAPIQPTLAGDYDLFVTKVAPGGGSLVYSTFLGGSADDRGNGVAVDAEGNVFVTGYTKSANFPLVEPIQAAVDAPRDAIALQIDPSGATLLSSTPFGGAGDDTAVSVALDPASNMYIVGQTTSTDLLLLDAEQATEGGDADAFVAQITPAKTDLGLSCTESGKCKSGFCADGVCCDAKCDDQCSACDTAGHVGNCLPAQGVPHGQRPACSGAGPCGAVCDGTTTANCTYPQSDVVCATVCDAGVQTASACDGQGDCVLGSAQSCNNFACADDGITCKATCTVVTDCLSGFTCTNGQCVQGATCVDDHTSQPLSGPAVNCTPYKCQDACLTTCASVDDCVSPTVCNASGHCVDRPSSGDSGGCSVDRDGDDSNTSFGALAVLGISVYLRGRRRRATA